MRWWAYLHTDGNIHVRRYRDESGDADMEEANESDFVAELYGPFDAANTEAAEEIATQNLRG